MRINKFLAKAGLGSRRSSEQFILQGKIKVNGEICTDLSTQIKDNDVVTYKDKRLSINPLVYYKLNKPVGYTTTLKDPYAEKLIVDLIEEELPVHPVGRLDRDSCGLILLTNDGNLTYQLTHPKYHLPKTYLVRVKGHPKKDELQILKDGVLLDGYKTRQVEITYKSSNETSTLFEVVLREGRNRQIRRLFKHIHYPVIFLQRIKIGSLSLKNLKEGEYKELTKSEIEMIDKDINDCIKDLR